MIRACGKVVCSLCSSNKAPLKYLNYKTDRVCDDCFIILKKQIEEQIKSNRLNVGTERKESLNSETKIRGLESVGGGNSIESTKTIDTIEEDEPSSISTTPRGSLQGVIDSKILESFSRIPFGIYSLSTLIQNIYSLGSLIRYPSVWSK